MAEYLKRLEVLVGEDRLSFLNDKHVLVCGVGGVGSFVCEALSNCWARKYVTPRLKNIPVLPGRSSRAVSKSSRASSYLPKRLSVMAL